MPTLGTLTHYGENRLCDMLRGVDLTLPASWRITPLSAASKSAQTEVTGSGIARAAVTRALPSWSGTQGPGSVLASSGTSKMMSNNADISMGTAAGAVGTVTHVGWVDAASGGNCWAYAPLATPIVTAAAVALLLPAGSLAFRLGAAGFITDYFVNLLLDRMFRGQAFTYPASTWLAATKLGVEVGGGVGYARKELLSSLTALSGTQAPGSTAASSGTSGRTSINDLIAFDDPTGSWGDIDGLEVYGASTLGNKYWLNALAAVKTIGVGLPLTFQADSIGFAFS